jgi:hypothetical protein
LRVLFLGQITLTKGIAAILEALIQLRGAPVEFWFVGPALIDISPEWLNNKQARWLGSVPRGGTAQYFPVFTDVSASSSKGT